jgi:hypothetical protein
MSIPWNTDADKEIFEEEMREHLCYDVWVTIGGLECI